MIASVSGRPCRAARTTDSGLPPTPTQVRSVPVSIGGYMVWPAIGGRVVPLQVTGPRFSSSANSAQLVLEQLLVARQVVAEQRIRLGERAAAEDHLGASVRDRVERREPLEHAHGIVGAEHGHRRPEEDPLGPAGDRGQHDLGRGDREVAAMVFADAESVDADLFGEDRFARRRRAGPAPAIAACRPR